MSYQEIAPSADLRDWVESYWIRRPDEGNDPAHVLPDGCADVIFDLTRGGTLCVGTMTRPLEGANVAQSEMFGVRFRPGRAAPFFDVPLGVMTDMTSESRRFKFVDEQLAEARDRVQLVEAKLLEIVRRSEPDRRVDEAVRLIIASRGVCDIDDVAQRAAASRQHLARLFGVHVGVTPKMFARVARFRFAIALLRKPRTSFADVAAHAGYYDQSHLIADFREFSGSTPVPFFQSNVRSEQLDSLA